MRPKLYIILALLVVLGGCGKPETSNEADTAQPPLSPAQAIQQFQHSPQVKDFEFIWDDHPGSNAFIAPLIGKNVYEIIDILKNTYDIKILILSSSKEAGLLGEKINLSNDADVSNDDLNYYEYGTDKQTRVWTARNKGKAAAQYIPKYGHLNHTHITKITRPFQNTPLMLVTDQIDRESLLHEFVHHYQFFYIRNKNAIEIEGQQHHLLCKDVINNRLLKKDLAKKITDYNSLTKKTFVFNKTIKQARQEVITETLKTYISQFNLIFKLGSNEIDVYRFLFENADILGLDEEAKRFQNVAVAYYLDEIETEYNRASKAYKESLKLFSDDIQEDEYFKSLTLQISALKQNIRQKFYKSSRWHNRRVRK